MAGEGGVLGQEELYRLALTYYKEQEVHLPLQLRVELVALSQQAKQGSLEGADLPPLGTFDIVGKERRAAWAALGDLGQPEAKASLVAELLKAVPQFEEFVARKTEEKVKGERKRVEEEARSKEEEATREVREEEQQVEEKQRRAIQVGLGLSCA